MNNLKINQFVESIRMICKKSLEDGVPSYAISLGLEKILHEQEKITSTEMQKEYELLQEQAKHAVPAEAPVEKNLEDQ